MRKLLPFFVFPLVFLGVVQAQSIGPQVINSTGGSYKIPSSNFVLDWNVGEMTLVRYFRRHRLEWHLFHHQWLSSAHQIWPCKR